jgi:hypothetical protein
MADADDTNDALGTAESRVRFENLLTDILTELAVTKLVTFVSPITEQTLMMMTYLTIAVFGRFAPCRCPKLSHARSVRSSPCQHSHLFHNPIQLLV